MAFDWDGTGTNGTTIPDGLYTYLLTAQTNGAALQGGGGGGGGGSPPSPMMAAMAAGETSYFVEPPPMPPVKKDGKWYSWDEIYGPLPPIEVKIPESVQERFLQSLQIQAGFGAATSLMVSSPDFGGGQNMMFAGATQATRAPKRKPRIGVKNKSGTFGICYKTYPNGYLAQAPRTGWPAPPLPIYVAIDSLPVTPGFIDWVTLRANKPVADGFSRGMKIGGWKEKFIKADDQWGPLDITKASLGGGSIFNTCNFGFLLTHGCYATTPESDNVKYTYMALWNNKLNQSSYVRLGDMKFGAPGTNGLKWMTILSCNSLRPANVDSMLNAQRFPANGDELHLLMGATTFTYSVPLLGIMYASNMVFNVTIANAWRDAGIAAYKDAKDTGMLGMTNAVTFRVMGYDSCVGDTLYQFNDPDSGTTFQRIDTPVFTP